MSLTIILDWYATLNPGAKAKLSLHELHRLAKALSSEVQPVGSERSDEGNLPPDEPISPLKHPETAVNGDKEGGE